MLKVVWDPKTNTTRYSPIWAQTRIYYNFPDVRTDRPAGSPGTIVEPFPDDFQVQGSILSRMPMDPLRANHAFRPRCDQMVAGNPGKKVGGRYLQEDLSIFYYREQDFSGPSDRALPVLE